MFCFIGLTILSSFTSVNLLNAVPLSCISVNKQPCKARPEVVNVNSNNPVFYHLSIKTRTNETRRIKWHQKCKCICRCISVYVSVYVSV